jgi:probable rRNA maturation factor
MGWARAWVEISFLTDADIRVLNDRHRKKNKATDVLSFVMGAAFDSMSQLPVGDILISVDTAQRQAKRAGRSLHEEYLVLIIHGLWHLYGLDHKTRKQWLVMRQREINSLQSVGIANVDYGYNPEDDA